MQETIIIPARYNSSRLPGKPLAEINGKPLIQWVYQQACKASPKRIIVATDDSRIQRCAESFGAEVCLTAATHPTGTDRLAEVVSKLKFQDDEVVVNLQGDAPLISPALLQAIASHCQVHQDAAIATFKRAITHPAEINNPNVVKVVSDQQGYALYFSRAAIPHQRDHGVRVNYWEHVGIYAYRVGFLREFARLAPSPLEQAESLEQLRALWHGYRIFVAETQEQINSADVNTPEDLARVSRLLTAAQAEQG